MQNIGVYFRHYRFICYAQNLFQKFIPTVSYSTTFDGLNAFYYPIIITDRNLKDERRTPQHNLISTVTRGHFTDAENQTSVDITKLSALELDNMLFELQNLNKDKEVIQLISNCLEKRVTIGKSVLKKFFREYSSNGKVDLVERLRGYCLKILPVLYEKSGEFLHYSAKAQCLKGNSEKGLSLLSSAYKKYENLRGFYRIIMKELIHDSVMNRSEASMVIFKKYVLEFSDKWNDSYPLVCFWHVCWKSDWFSDQMLADELLDSSKCLQNIIKDMASTLCLSALKEYNDDAVTRLLQILLKYKMMDEYTNVLQILFNFKLRNRDIRGCTEILRNCDVLGVTLPSHLQSQFIRLLIKRPDEDKPNPTKPNFKLKF